MSKLPKGMGHGISRRKKEPDVFLPNSELTFTPSQLFFLNYHFSDQLTNLSAELRCELRGEDSSVALVEQLMQRLLYGVGTLDPRFSCKLYVIAAELRCEPRGVDSSVALVEQLMQRLLCGVGTLDPRFSCKLYVIAAELRCEPRGEDSSVALVEQLMQRLLYGVGTLDPRFSCKLYVIAAELRCEPRGEDSSLALVEQLMQRLLYGVGTLDPRFSCKLYVIAVELRCEPRGEDSSVALVERLMQRLLYGVGTLDPRFSCKLYVIAAELRCEPWGEDSSVALVEQLMQRLLYGVGTLDPRFSCKLYVIAAELRCEPWGEDSSVALVEQLMQRLLYGVGTLDPRFSCKLYVIAAELRCEPRGEDSSVALVEQLMQRLLYGVGTLDPRFSCKLYVIAVELRCEPRGEDSSVALVERLMQRLLYGVGTLDPRFSCKLYVIAAELRCEPRGEDSSVALVEQLMQRLLYGVGTLDPRFSCKLYVIAAELRCEPRGEDSSLALAEQLMQRLLYGVGTLDPRFSCKLYVIAAELRCEPWGEDSSVALVEQLMQRLLYGVGTLDPRFSCKLYVIAAELRCEPWGEDSSVALVEQLMQRLLYGVGALDPRFSCKLYVIAAELRCEPRGEDSSVALVERLLQRLLYGVGTLDSRFSCKLYVIAAELRCEPRGVDSSVALVERLMQRLLCGVGTLDPRFSCKLYVIAAELRCEPRGEDSSVALVEQLMQRLLYGVGTLDPRFSCKLYVIAAELRCEPRGEDSSVALVERLLQRLLYGVGTLDPRFSCKLYVIAAELRCEPRGEDSSSALVEQLMQRLLYGVGTLDPRFSCKLYVIAAELRCEPWGEDSSVALVERLLQRLLYGVGTLDPRFSCKLYVIAAELRCEPWGEDSSVALVEQLMQRLLYGVGTLDSRFSCKLYVIAAELRCEPRGEDSSVALVERLMKRLLYGVGTLDPRFSCKLYVIAAELRCEPRGEDSSVALVERLMQRLLCGVGTLDPRFSCKFLVNLDPTRPASRSLSYLVRLDNLSTPLLYPQDSEQPTCSVLQTEGGPQGFAKVRPSGPKLQDWAEFINNNGFLRRDKVQERFVELLAAAASRTSLPEPPDHIDESRLCGAPGKVVDPEVAFYLASSPPQNQFYFGTAECHRHSFPDPREFRLAIVEGTPCVRLRVGLQPPNCYSTSDEDVEVTLTLGIGFTGWPQNCDFPSRVPLYHVDSLLYHQAATLGFYLVPAPPHPTTRCDDRSATWQFRFPATECALLTHYSAHSTPARVLAVLRNILSDLRRTTNGGQVISDYMLKTLLWFRLEEDNGSLIGILRDWDHNKLSLHVLVILDQLINGLRTQRHRSYWFPWFNVMLSAPGGGTMHYTEEDYCHDAELLVSLLCRLHEHSHQPLLPSLHVLEPWQLLDSRLIGKWQDVLMALAPPAATRSRRLGFVPGYNTAAASQYSARQLEYVRLILRGMLTVRALTLYQGQLFPNLFNNNNTIYTPSDTVESSEDLIYLLTSILDQAKVLHSTRKSHDTRAKRTVKSYSRSLPKRDSANFTKRLDSYETAISRLIEEVRRDSSTSDLTVDSVLVKELLKWLYHGMDTERRHLSPILRPFLNRLFTVSHESCWHIEEWKRRQENQELYALGKFAKLVVEDGLSPRDGIADAIRKGWQWAERVIDTASEHSEGVELVFTPSPGRVLRYRVRLHQQSTTFSTRSLGRNISFSKADSKLSFATLPRHTNGIKELLKAKQDNRDTVDSVHCRLRAANPITNAVDSQRRYGTHRGVGSIVEALVTLNKFSVLQEVSNLLPEDERAQVLDDIQRVSKVRRRGRGRGAPGGGGQPTQRYRPVPECAPLSQAQPPPALSSDSSEWLAELPSAAKSLLGTCREARQRQSTTSIYNSAFFEPSTSPNPLGQPLLRLTPDNRLTLETSHTHHNKVKRAHNKEMVTKL